MTESASTSQASRPEPSQRRVRLHNCSQLVASVNDILSKRSDLPSDIRAQLERCVQLEGFSAGNLRVVAKLLHGENDNNMESK
jgi:Flp pilus assembly protein TadD